MRRATFDLFLRLRLWCSQVFADRPIQLLGYLIGAAILVSAVGYSAVTSTANKSDLERFKASFCNGQIDTLSTRRVCNELLGKLIEHPTRAQAHRLKEIVRTAP